MLNQNTKGFLTLLTITGIITSVFYGYKGLIEPNLMRSAELFPVELTQINIAPKVEIKATKADITWENTSGNESLIYTTKKQDCIDKNTNCITLKAQVSGNQSTVEITDLKEKTDYFYKIIIEDKEFPQEKENFFSFKQPATTTLETKPIESNPLPDPKKIQEAFKNQDLTYDMNGDGKVTIADLYILNSKAPK